MSKIGKWINHGFTLIEVIIAVGIIAISVGVGTRIYMVTAHQRQLDKSADEFMNVLFRTKQRTIARDVAPLVPSPGCTNFQGYAVLVKTNNTYEDRILCDASTTTLNTYSLERAQFNGMPSNIQLNFIYPYGSLGGTAQTITIRSSQIGRCITITIPQLGPISKSDQMTC